MSLTLLGWILIASSIAMSALAIVPLGPRRLRSDAFDLQAWFSLSGWRVEQAFQSAARTLMVTVAVFLFVAGVGAATTYISVPPASTASADTDDGMVARLDDYVRSIGPETPAPKAADSALLPDVNTMIDRLAARLESAPDDVKGWRMLGWSYFNTGLYEQATAAYAKAATLDPGNEEIARAYEEAKTKVSEGDNSDTAGKKHGMR